QILGADLVESANNAPLEDAPKAFNRVRVHSADNVFVVRMANDLMLVAIDLPQAVIANPLIGHEQADLLGNRLGHKFVEQITTDRFNDAGDHVALPLNSADNRDFTGTKTS